MSNGVWYFQNSTVFSRLTEEDAQALCQRALIRQFAKGEQVREPNRPQKSLLILAKGCIKLKNVTPEGKEAILAFLSTGDMFGDLELDLDESAEPNGSGVFAEAVTQSTVVSLDHTDVVRLMDRQSSFARSIGVWLSRRQQQWERRVRDLLFLSGKKRLMRGIVELAQTHGQWQDQQCTIRFPLTQQDLASFLGLARETVTILLSELESEQMINVRRKQITVVDLPKLKAKSEM